MPLRKEVAPFYKSPEWRETRARILARAQSRCETCNAPNGETVLRVPGWYYRYEEDVWVNDRTGQEQDWDPEYEEDGRLVKIVLTIAHLDEGHTGEMVPDDRLKAMCQKCHLALDRPRHVRTAKRNRHAKRNGGTALELEESR